MLLHVGRHITKDAIWTAWTFDPVLVCAIGATVTGYTLGTRRGRMRPSVWRWRARAFHLGIGTLVIALISPLDALAEELFAAHMTQHVLLAVVAPPLIVFAAPHVAMLSALSREARARTVSIAHRVGRSIWWNRLGATPFAAMVNVVVLWGWHAPPLYQSALVHPAVHAAEHMSLLGAGVLLWWSILHGRMSRRASYGIGIVALFFTMLHGSALGALIALSRRPWYPAQSHGAAMWGLTPLADQQMAGLIMWVVAGLLQLATVGALFVAWMRACEASARRRAVVAVAAVTLVGCARVEGSPIPGGNVERGRQALAAMGCGSCHAIAGVRGAHGLIGPPLTGIASRSIIAGQLANTPDNMMRWIMDPPAIVPRTAMPNLHVGAQSARDMAAYLYTLR